MKLSEASAHFGDSENSGYTIHKVGSTNTIFGRHDKQKFTTFIKLLKDCDSIIEAAKLAGIPQKRGIIYARVFLAYCQENGLPAIFNYNRKKLTVEQEKEYNRKRMKVYMQNKRAANKDVYKKKPIKVYSIEQLMKIHQSVIK